MLVSRQCIQPILKELEQVERVDADKVAYGCFIKKKHGLPYTCELTNIKI